MNVVLTREAGHNDVQRAWLPDDAVVLEVPLTTTRFFSPEEVARKLESCEHRGSFTALVVTSARAADYVAGARRALASGAQIVVVGPATARALADRGIEVSAEASSRAIEIAELIERGPVLQLGASEIRDELGFELSARGSPLNGSPAMRRSPSSPTPPPRRSSRTPTSFSSVHRRRGTWRVPISGPRRGSWFRERPPVSSCARTTTW
jgi:uroporphyrinogen-III synthase